MSNKKRVYELAKDHGLETKDVLRRLAELGVDAGTASSSVSPGDALRFKEALGTTADQRRKVEEDAKRKEQDELERYKTMDAKAPAKKKAAKVLPPHLRKAQEEKDAAAAAAQAVAGPAGEATEAPVAAATVAPAAAAVPSKPMPMRPPGSAPAAGTVPGTETKSSGGAAGTSSASVPLAAGQAPMRRMPGAPPPKIEPGQAPMRPNLSKASPSVTGEGVAPVRRVEQNLPLEGSGRRSIPKPLERAEDRPQRPAPAPRGGPAGGPGGPRGGPGGARGGPGGARGGPGGPRSNSPYRGAVPGGAAPARGGPPAAAATPGSPPAAGEARVSGKRRRNDKTTPQEQEQARGPMRRDIPIEELVEGIDRVDVLPGVTVGELADKLGVPGASVVKKLFSMGEMVTVQQSLPDDTLEILGAELGFEVKFLSDEEVEFGIEVDDAEEDLSHRPPVVTIMGHVDHGKTLLLDAIREADVVSGEAGGITQHIGAYQVHHGDGLITFIDTPGHEAFTAMRARGADVTDIIILVVAANDGVMPQTVEAIAHAKAAGVPIIVAINKMDLESATPDKVKGQLTEYELVAEEFGGDTPMVPVSAKTHDGLADLLEIIVLQAEVLELQANSTKAARGRVIEAHLDKGRGPVATVLVQAGTLTKGEILVAGESDGRIRAMFDADGAEVKEAGPGTPVQILGLNEIPEAGDEFRVVKNARTASDIASRRQERHRRMQLAEQSRPMTLEDLTAEVAQGELETLNVIIKADVSGSAEALEQSLLKLELEGTQIKVVGKGVGAVNKSDVLLAETSKAIVIAFNVRPDANARTEIDRSGVDLRIYKIIYEALEDIERAVLGLLGPEFKEQVIGEAEVRETFKVPKAGTIAGVIIRKGIVKRDAGVRVIRDGVVVTEDTTMISLRRFKDDVNEVREGFECGIGLKNYNDIKEGDIFEVFETVEVERTV
ncbi:MAG: translation initiation factor IF-2 [Nitriliruptoraceae bacterium]